MCSRSLLVIAIASVLAACGGGDSGPDHECFVPDDHGSATLSGQSAEGAGEPTAPTFIVLQSTLNDDAKPDIFALEFYAGSGALANGIEPGTYELSGAELNYETCGVCPRIFTDCDTTTGDCEDLQYYTTGGSVTITAINPNITGTISGVTLEEVTVDMTTFHTTPVEGGCTTEIGSASFDAAVTF